MAVSIHERAVRLKKERRKALVPYFMGLWPSAAVFQELVAATCDSGADAIEVGMPFSDPVADGKEIQSAGREALEAGTTPLDVFRESGRIANRFGIPLMLMTYANPVYRMGLDRFCMAAAESGFSGLIVPDVPLEESDGLCAAAALAKISLIRMIAAGSDEARIARVVFGAEGFVYLVSVKGVTGSGMVEPSAGREARIAMSHTGTPVYSGFGISTPERAGRAAAWSDGVIAGSAFISEYRAAGVAGVARLVRGMRDAVDRGLNCKP